MSLTSWTMWTLIIGAGIGSLALRCSFIMFARRLQDAPEEVHDVLRLVPPASFAALVLPTILRPDGAWTGLSAELVAAALAAVIAWKTRSITWTILVGLACVVLVGIVL